MSEPGDAMRELLTTIEVAESPASGGAWQLGSAPVLLPGRLPDGLPFPLPPIDGASIAGSAAMGNRVVILMDVLIEPHVVIERYRDHFLGLHWSSQTREDYRVQGMSAGQGVGPEWGWFKAPGDGPRVLVQAQREGEERTTCLLQIDLVAAPSTLSDSPAQLAERLKRARAERGLMAKILAAAPDVERVSSHEYRAGTPTEHPSRDDAGAAQWFTQTLQAQGWTLIAAEVNPPLAWSRWERVNDRGERERATWTMMPGVRQGDMGRMEMTLDRNP